MRRNEKGQKIQKGTPEQTEYANEVLRRARELRKNLEDGNKKFEPVSKTMAEAFAEAFPTYKTHHAAIKNKMLQAEGLTVWDRRYKVPYDAAFYSMIQILKRNGGVVEFDLFEKLKKAIDKFDGVGCSKDMLKEDSCAGNG